MIKVGMVEGYERYWIKENNPMDMPNKLDFGDDDIGYLTEMSVWKMAEDRRKVYPIIESHQKIAKKFLRVKVSFSLVLIDGKPKSKIIIKTNN
jgi:hypothetical protein